MAGPFEAPKDYLLESETDNYGLVKDKKSFGTTPSIDKIAYGKPKMATMDKLIPRSLRTEQIAKAGVFAGTTLGELVLINKIKKAQLARTMLSEVPIQTTVAPAADMPAEVLNQRTNEISKLRSQYRGSDRATDLISNQVAAAGRVSAMDKLAAERGSLLLDERRRVAEQTAANQVRMGEGYNRNIERQQALNDYKLESIINADEHKKKLLSQVGTQLTDNLETAQAYDTHVALSDKQDQLRGIQAQYDQKAEELRVALDKGDVLSQKALRQEMQGLMNQYNTLVQKDYAGTYWSKSPYLKNGGKLIPRI